MKKGLIIGIIIVVGVVIYFGFVKDTPSGDDFLTTQSPADNGVLGRDINNALSKINSLNINNDLFRKPTFQVLVDYSSIIPDQIPGRNNPFLRPDPSAGADSIPTVNGNPIDESFDGIQDVSETGDGETGEEPVSEPAEGDNDTTGQPAQ